MVGGNDSRKISVEDEEQELKEARLRMDEVLGLTSTKPATNRTDLISDLNRAISEARKYQQGQSATADTFTRLASGAGSNRKHCLADAAKGGVASIDKASPDSQGAVVFR